MALSQQPLEHIYEDFLSDRLARGCKLATIENIYAPNLLVFVRWCEDHNIQRIDDITTADLRAFTTMVQETHNQGGTHIYFRVVKTFIRWYDAEYEPKWRRLPTANWKVKAPSTVAMPGITLDKIMRIISVCKPRDKTILLFLVETGLRASELCNLNMEDYEPRTGAVHVIYGKGDQTRTVYAGSKTRIQMLRYLRTREGTGDDPLFIQDEGLRITYTALRGIVRRASQRARIPEPGLHDFRRCCAITLLRNGMDLALVSHWLGHGSITVTMRYLRLVREDLRKAQITASPVDRWYRK